MGFASVMTIGNEVAPKGKKCSYKGEGKKRAGVAGVPTGVFI